MKARPNKLDAFSARLDEWSHEGKTLAQMQAALKDDGCICSLSSLSDWLSRRRQAHLEAQLFAQIATGARMNKELDSAFAENPVPDIEQLIRITRSNIMTLQVQGAANPKLLLLANSMQQTVLNFLSAQTKARLQEQKLGLDARRVKLLEEKASQADAAKAVTESALTPEEKAQRMKQIFGMA